MKSINLFIQGLLIFLIKSVCIAQLTTIYVEDFESCSEGTLPMCSWSKVSLGSPWTITNNTCVIAGIYSLAIASDSNYCEYNKDSGISDGFAYVSFSTLGYENNVISFDWKSGGETGIDFGKVIYSIDGLAWYDVWPLQYQGQPNTQTESNLPLPSAIDNASTAYFGFKWEDNSSSGVFPGFIIDNITIQGEPIVSSVNEATEYYSRLNIYPNPFTNSTRINFHNQQQEIFEMSIFDITGKKNMTQSNITGNGVLLDKGTLTSGMYFIELKSASHLYKGKLLIR